MKIEVLSEYGFFESLLGLGLSHGLTSSSTIDDVAMDPTRLKGIALSLAGKGHGHDKFLRMMTVTLDITAPLYWWKEFDTYKVGTVAQSESTMHTLMDKPFELGMFEGGMGLETLHHLERARQSGDFEYVNRNLPQSFLQRRIIMTNYAALHNILNQRKGHKLREWSEFIHGVLDGVGHAALLQNN